MVQKRVGYEQEYVAGFLFDPTQEFVVLVRKNKPEWQKGLLNGVGGKIEVGESAHEAMQREFKEEATADIIDWTLFRTEVFTKGSGAVVHFFYATATKAQWHTVKSAEEEQLLICIVREARPGSKEFIYNLPYLLPMARVLMSQPEQNFPQP